MSVQLSFMRGKTWVALLCACAIVMDPAIAELCEHDNCEVCSDGLDENR